MGSSTAYERAILTSMGRQIPVLALPMTVHHVLRAPPQWSLPTMVNTHASPSTHLLPFPPLIPLSNTPWRKPPIMDINLSNTHSENAYAALVFCFTRPVLSMAFINRRTFHIYSRQRMNSRIRIPLFRSCDLSHLNISVLRATSCFGKF